MPGRKQGTATAKPSLNARLLELMERKRKWHYRPDLQTQRQGFRGWHERGYLPHFDAPNVTQFVTIMLEDAFPIIRRREWEPILKESDESARRRKLEAWLDRGHGECWLRRFDVARLVEEVLRRDDGVLYLLQAWVIMPNHAHLVVDIWQTPLSKLLNLWKGRSARGANLIIDRRGSFWQKEYFDTRVRDAEHLARAIRYTEKNPSKACLVSDPRQWPWSSARERDEYGRLPQQRR
jgi:REP element-mobilizing transposase RayT